jgi:hypothetical protein
MMNDEWGMMNKGGQTLFLSRAFAFTGGIPHFTFIIHHSSFIIPASL